VTGFHYPSTRSLLVVDARDVKQRTALHYAASVGNSDVIVLLLDSAADAGVQDVTGMTPLHLSVSQALLRPSKVHTYLAKLYHNHATGGLCQYG